MKNFVDKKNNSLNTRQLLQCVLKCHTIQIRTKRSVYEVSETKVIRIKYPQPWVISIYIHSFSGAAIAIYVYKTPRGWGVLIFFSLVLLNSRCFRDFYMFSSSLMENKV